MGFGFWSLQLRDSPGFTPGSLLIDPKNNNESNQKRCKGNFPALIIRRNVFNTPGFINIRLN